MYWFFSKAYLGKTQLRVELRTMKATAAIRLSLMASGVRFRIR